MPAASAAEQQAYAAGMNYATPTINIGKGDTLTFTNLDSLAKHDLLGEGFASPLLGANETAPVAGVEKLEQGQYQFHCSLHGWMQGVLNVGPSGSGAPGPGGGGGGAGGTPTAPTDQVAQDPYDSYLHATKGSIGDASWPFYGNDAREHARRRQGRAIGGRGAEPRRGLELLLARRRLHRHAGRGQGASSWQARTAAWSTASTPRPAASAGPTRRAR